MLVRPGLARDAVRNTSYTGGPSEWTHRPTWLGYCTVQCNTGLDVYIALISSIMSLRVPVRWVQTARTEYVGIRLRMLESSGSVYTYIMYMCTFSPVFMGGRGGGRILTRVMQNKTCSCPTQEPKSLFNSHVHARVFIV